MKIRTIEPIPLRYQIPSGAYGSARGLVPARATCLVRMETDDGLLGLGEAFGPPLVIAAQVRELSPIFLGADPFDHEKLWAVATNGRYHWGRTGLHIAALSGLETACWDLMGKATGLPIAKLLGGWNRDTVTAYASTGYFCEDPGGYRRLIEAAASEGFGLIKIKCGDGLRSDLERIDLVTEIAGPETGVMVDLNGNYTADLALQLAPALEARQVVWLEEPVPPEDFVGYARLRAGSRVPLASGEADALRIGFRDLVTQRLVDVVQPDVTTCGGLAEAKAIVRMAQTWNVRFSPHVWGGAIAIAAALQLVAATPLHPHVGREPAPLLFEYDRGPNALRDELLTTPFQVAGDQLTIPRGPGLGVELDWDAVARFRIAEAG